MQEGLTAEIASRFSGIVLSNVTREYPNKMDHVMLDAADVKGPRALHPLFYGSFRLYGLHTQALGSRCASHHGASWRQSPRGVKMASCESRWRKVPRAMMPRWRLPP